MASHLVDTEKARLSDQPLEMDRRSFLALGGGAVALSLMGGILPDAARAASRRLEIRYVITDRRYQESLRFGQILVMNGSTRLEVTDGLTRLWQEALVPLWKEPGRVAAVAGLTSREVRTCLAEQARSHGRQAVLMGQHTLGLGSGATAHVIAVPHRMSSAVATIGSRGRVWPSAMAELIGLCPADARVCDSEWRSGGSMPLRSSFRSLTSWVIA